MDTIVRPPVAAPPSDEPPPRRRRWVRILVLVVIGLLLLGLPVGSIWIANDVPIEQGSFGFGTLRSDVRQIDIDSFDISGVVFEVPVGREARFRYRFSIRNDGPFAVTIRQIGDTGPWGGDSRLGRRAVGVVADAYAGTASPFERWHAFSLPPGGEALIEMEASYRGRCIDRDSSISWNVEPMTFSILGITREDFVPVGVEVRFVGTGCRTD
jgi:hypothetical protein